MDMQEMLNKLPSEHPDSLAPKTTVRYPSMEEDNGIDKVAAALAALTERLDKLEAAHVERLDKLEANIQAL